MVVVPVHMGVLRLFHILALTLHISSLAIPPLFLLSIHTVCENVGWTLNNATSQSGNVLVF